MARNLKSSDVVSYLLQGGDISRLSDMGVSQRALMAAFLSSPELVNKYRTKAEEQVEPYASYDPTFGYNPETNINEVESKYYAMPEKYASFAKNFWDKVKAVGANSSEVARIKKDINSKKEQYAQAAGLTNEEFNELYNSLGKDVEGFQRAEARRDKSQYGAFIKQRGKLGITGEGDEATEQYLAGMTGVKGLSSMPTSVEDFVKQKSSQFVSSISKGKKLSKMAKKSYVSQFEKALKEQVGKDYKKFAVKDLLKKNLLGE